MGAWSRISLWLSAVSLAAALALLPACQAPADSEVAGSGTAGRSDASAESSAAPLLQGVASVELVEEGSWEWSPDIDCAPCHTYEAETAAFGACEASLREDAPCLPCHDDAASLQEVHVIPFDNQPGERLRSTEADSEACADCHASDDLAEATASSAVLVDQSGTAVNPHDLPAHKNHSNVACASCHHPHSETPARETAQETCLGCHHMGVYKCGTCHE